MIQGYDRSTISENMGECVTLGYIIFKYRRRSIAWGFVRFLTRRYRLPSERLSELFILFQDDNRYLFAF